MLALQSHKLHTKLHSEQPAQKLVLEVVMGLPMPTAEPEAT
jgi:hypothetical protein